MEPDLSFDFDFPLQKTNSRRWSWPIRSIGSLMVLIALSCLSMTVMARGTRRQTNVTVPIPRRAPSGPILTPKAAPGVPLNVMPAPRKRTNRFVIEADADIDPKMVIKANPTIDPEMVFNPEASSRRSLSIDPMPEPDKFLVPRPPSEPREFNPQGPNQRPR
jgi:hypothetical protein